jgi:hypothetical protein
VRLLLITILTCAVVAASGWVAAEERDGVTYYGNEDLQGRGVKLADEYTPRAPGTRVARPSVAVGAPKKSGDIDFQVVGRTMSALNISVPDDATDAQCEALINKFRDARKAGTLGKLIPPTTPGSAKGDYGVVWIFLFSASDRVSVDHPKRFIESSPKRPIDRQFNAEFVNYIRGVYYYAPVLEEGSIGYKGENISSLNFKRLFYVKK